MYTIDLNTFPSEFVIAYEKMSPAAKDLWRQDRLRALTDGIYLGTEIMGMDFQENPHRALFKNFLNKDQEQKTPLYDLDLKVKKRMILWSRGTFKTSSIIVEIVQLILNFPNIRILFLTGSDPLAKRQLARVKKVFERPTKKFKQLFPEFCGTDLGTISFFIVPARTNDNFPEPTFAISTAKSVKAGSHYDVIFVDDLVNETNYRSPKALQKCIQDYKDVCPLLAPDGFMYVTGTRYSFGDLYEDIQKLAKEEMAALGRQPWKFSVRTCWVEKCGKCGHDDINHNQDANYTHPPCTRCDCGCFVSSNVREVLFPKFRCRDGRTEGHSVEFLESEKLRLGPDMFSCQYENNPIATGTQTFTQELIDRQTLLHVEQLPTALMAQTFIMGDLSYVGDEKRDVSVLFIMRYMDGQLFEIECIAGKWDSEQVAEHLFLAIMKYRPSIIWLERFLGWEAYDNVFRSFANSHNIQRFPVEWLKMSQVAGAKQLRIGAIKGVLSQRRLWLYAGAEHYEILVEQLKKWPKSGKHDDFADCLALACQAPIGFQNEKGPQHIDDKPMEAQTSIAFLRKLHKASEKDTTDVRIPGSY